MSTRACYTFKDKDGAEYHVYKHHDGYPTGAAGFIMAALEKAWQLPRFEADEFAASFVAANKDSCGGVRLMHSGSIKDVAPGDIAYRYLVEPSGETLQITAYSTNYWGEKPLEKQVFKCLLPVLAATAKRKTAKRKQAA